ncbi:MAG: 50S ribosomal protein L35 [Lentisphaerae bacterium]|jgi:large subunit ribosomal protein L35|nr:50S ribosomal protein L35 [Lentisphaerota bacterium]
MPKMKTKKALVKRFKKTATGKIKAGRPFRGHLLSGKTGNRKRALRKSTVIADVEQKRIKDLF